MEASERAIGALSALVQIVGGNPDTIKQAVRVYEAVTSGIPPESVADRVAPMISDDPKTSAVFGAMWMAKALEEKMGKS